MILQKQQLFANPRSTRLRMSDRYLRIVVVDGVGRERPLSRHR